jgi:hypothetical protein
MRRLTVVGCVLVFAGLLSTVQAQQAANPTGTWKWQQQGRGGQTQERTLKLKLDGQTLTGAVVVGQDNQEVAITEASFKDGTVSFKVSRPGRGGGQPRTDSYTGKLEGDTIKGKISTQRQGETVEIDWEAKRAAQA